MEDIGSAGRCQLPPELDDIDLIAAVDEEADQHVIQHLDQCAYCAARARVLAELQVHLRQRLYRLFCPTSDELAAFSEGLAAAEVWERIAEHIVDCSECQAEVAVLDRISAVPPERPPERPMRRVVAYPLRQSLAWPSDGAISETCVYQAGLIRVVLSVERQRGASMPRLRGRLTGTRQPGLTASLLSHGCVVNSVSLDDQGYFILDDVAPGDFSLSLRLHDYEVIVEALGFPWS